MLVISRKVGETIGIGADHAIIITVLSCSRYSVRLGIEAPTEVAIVRDDQKKGPEDGSN